MDVHVCLHVASGGRFKGRHKNYSSKCVVVVFLSIHINCNSTITIIQSDYDSIKLKHCSKIQNTPLLLMRHNADSYYKHSTH